MKRARSRISLVHPFSARSVGIVEKMIPESHSRPHVNALKHLAEDGFDCFIEYFTDGWLPYTVDRDSLKWKFHMLDRKWNGDHRKWKKQWSNSWLRKVKKYAPDITIINMSGEGSPFSMEMGRILHETGKPYVAMIGGIHITLNAPQLAYYNNASVILVHTEYQRKQLQAKEELANCLIQTFPLGVDCSYFKPAPSEENDKRRAELLYVGRIIELKRIHLAITAVHELALLGKKDAILRVVGPVVSETYYKELQAMTEDLGLRENVVFEGPVSYKDLLPYYQRADLLLMPSSHESFGMVIVESMACGTPVAAIKGTGAPDELIGGESHGLLASFNEYPRMVAELVMDIERLMEMRKHCRDRVMNCYSIESTAMILRSIVTNITN